MSYNTIFRNIKIFIKENQIFLFFITIIIICIFCLNQYSVVEEFRKKKKKKKKESDRERKDREKKERDEIDRENREREAASKMAALPIISETYTVSSTSSCGFYFKNNDYEPFFVKKDNLNSDIEKIFDYNDCFNIDQSNNNTLYSINSTSNAVTSYKYNDTRVTPNVSYQIFFTIIINNSDFLTCFKQLLTDCTYIKYRFKSFSKIITFDINNRKCIIELNVINGNTLLPNITVDNIVKVKYANKVVDLSKKYIYGNLFYGSDYYSCIALSV